MKTNPEHIRQPAFAYEKSTNASKEELAADVELVFKLVEEGLDKWQKNWNEEEIFNGVTALFKNIRELFELISNRSEEFTFEETNNYNDKFHKFYNAVVNKGREFNVYVPWPRRDFGM